MEYCRNCRWFRPTLCDDGTYTYNYGECESDDFWMMLDGEISEINHINVDGDFWCGYCAPRENKYDSSRNY